MLNTTPTMDNTMAATGYFSTGDIARAAGVTVATVTRWVALGLLHAADPDTGKTRMLPSSMDAVNNALALLRLHSLDPTAPLLVGATLRYLSLPAADRTRGEVHFPSFIMGYLAASPKGGLS